MMDSFCCPKFQSRPSSVPVQVQVQVPVQVPAVSGGSGSGPHDPEQGVDVVGLDGVPAGRDHLVLGFSH